MGSSSSSATSGRPTRTDRRKARTIRAILDAADQEFIAHGFERARVEDIAARADVAVGSIYVHFEGKLGLYLAVAELALDSLEEALGEAYGLDGSPGLRLIAVGERYVRFAREHPGQFRLLATPPALEPESLASPAARRLVERGDRLKSRLADLVRQGIEVGDVRDVDPDRTASFLWGAWTGVISLHLRADPLSLTDQELEEVLALGSRLVNEGLASR